MAKLTTQDLDEMIQNPEWRGHGYIGARESLRAGILTGERKPAEAKLLARADAMALDAANHHGYSAEQLFDWANSKKGRWYGDCWFGDGGKYANRYTPTPLNR